MSEVKITKAQNDGVARENAVVALGLDKLAKVSNTEYALIAKNAKGEDTVVIVKVTVPKSQEGVEALVEQYAADKAEKETAKAERDAKKATKTVSKKATKSESTDDLSF